ncbi:30S ribosomal protein S8 [Candidatus Woesebacteria bacterium]|nr:30S ribosomal protein S8 [Candidatus Woesebacteria bacterium]
MTTDPIADTITRIKNALMARHEKIEIPYSKMKKAVVDILLKEGYVNDVVVKEAKPFNYLVITLKYIGKSPAVNNVKRLSKPGRRLYAPVSKLPKTLGGYGITIVSTSKGVMTDKDARKANLGGELLCQIW